MPNKVNQQWSEIKHNPIVGRKSQQKGTFIKRQKMMKTMKRKVISELMERMKKIVLILTLMNLKVLVRLRMIKNSIWKLISNGAKKTQMQQKMLMEMKMTKREKMKMIMTTKRVMITRKIQIEIEMNILLFIYNGIVLKMLFFINKSFVEGNFLKLLYFDFYYSPFDAFHT